MAQRKRDLEPDRPASVKYAEWASLKARYMARIHGLATADVVHALSDAELRELAERSPDQPGSRDVLSCLEEAEELRGAA